jgi:poly-gamma-glutamate synthesis protein (capsule biosynthesis protein)
MESCLAANLAVTTAKQPEKKESASLVSIFLCGDVMTGRGIDQILPCPSEPTIHEPYVKNAHEYVQLAEEINGNIPEPVDFSYIWGDALNVLVQKTPNAKNINLETSITTSNDYWTAKGINYRMNPKNIPCLTTAQIDCSILANNHVLDWGYSGLTETLDTLSKANLEIAGAGQNLREASNPAIIDVSGKGRIIVFAFGSTDSGIPTQWAATETRPGVNLLKDYSLNTLQQIKEHVARIKRVGDIVVFSVHWGDNWGYPVPFEHQDFAHRLIDEANIDIIYGHSSHHVKGIEVYAGKLILYGCGDLINDYEGIAGYEEYRGDLSMMYFPTIEIATGNLFELRMVPMHIKRFRVNRAQRNDAEWLGRVLNKQGKKLGTSTKLNTEGDLLLSWN